MSTEMVTCSVCGSSVPAGVKFCPQCGHLMESASDAQMAASPPPAPSEVGTGDLLSATGSSGLEMSSHDEWLDTLARRERDPLDGETSSALAGEATGVDIGASPGTGETPGAEAASGETRYIPPVPAPPPTYSPGAYGSTPPEPSRGGEVPPPAYGGYSASPQGSEPSYTPPPPRYDERPQYTPPQYAAPQQYPQGIPPVPMGSGYAPQGFRCPYCGTTAPPLVRERVSQSGWIVLVVLLFVCFPLFWIGLLMKEPYRVCSQCGMMLG